MSPALKWGLIALLGAVAAAYFALLLVKAREFGRALLHRGYEARGITEAGMALRMRVLGATGLVVSLAALGVALARMAR